MQQRLVSLFLFISVLLLSLTTQASIFKNSSAPQFATVEQAFGFYAEQQGSQLEVSFQVKNGYYLYRHQFVIEAEQAQIGEYTIPRGTVSQDEFFGEIEALTGNVSFNIPIIKADEGAVIQITYQGCAEKGFCYPPETKRVVLKTVSLENAGNKTQANSFEIIKRNQASQTSTQSLPFSPLWALLIGIGIAFTPCVLPMYPFISGIILGVQKSSLKRVLALAFIYVQGMALTYTLLGIVVAAAGLKFQAAFQHPYLLIGLSVVFILFALSMFGVYSLQLPSSLQTRLNGLSARQKGGSFIGVFIMGAVAGLICSPCTTAPLTAILLYIAQSGDLVWGGSILYLYALGMGIPLILITVFGTRLLPTSGPWMQYVKEFFGFVILALPVFLLERIVGEQWGMIMWSGLVLAICVWGFMALTHTQSGWSRFLQIVLLATAMVAARPLQNWIFNDATSTENVASSMFKRIDSVSELKQQIKAASGTIVMVDFYADWCVACKEFEKYTFTDPRVKNILADKVLLQADVTKNNAQHVELYEEYNILGLPTILFFDEQGNELTSMRITGFMNADEFLLHLGKLLTSLDKQSQ